jgi:NifU-like protein involved in Fe-S cluster formation
MAQLLYSQPVLSYFARPPLSAGGSYVGRAGREAQGAVIAISTDLRAGTLHNMAFRTWGCPHIIAACACLTERLAGQPVEVLEPESLAQELARVSKYLDIPAEKAGKILILMDALWELRAVLAAAPASALTK